MFSALLSPEVADRSTNDERRAGPRHRVDLQIHWNPEPGNPNSRQEGRAHDISTLGIGLVLSQPRDISTFLEIELPETSGHARRLLLSRVVHVEELPGQWLIGCAFVSELTAAELALFTAEPAQPTGHDHRRWTRFPCNVETVCYTCETAPGERRSGRILNISAGGVGLFLRCSFTPGTLLYFDLPGNGSVSPRQILIRVVRALEHSKGNWFLGCEFAAQLQEDELFALLNL